MMHWFNDYSMGHFGMGGFGFFFMIVFWGLVVWGVISLIRTLAAQKDGEAHHETAEDIVRKRFARGEIDKEEFENLLKSLRS